MFDDRVYKRGALLVHALRREVGDAAFFAALKTYTMRSAHGVVEPFDLVNALKTHAPNADVDGVMDAWLNHPALPECP